MVFGKKFNKNLQENQPKILIEDTALELVKETKFLGIYLDSELNWKKHINYISTKIAKSIGIISRANQILGTKYLLQLYYSFIFPYLIYCNVIWGNASASTIWTIFRLQKIAIRIITNTKRGNSSKTHCIELRILRVPEIYIYSTTIFIYKYMNQMMPTNLTYLFQKIRMSILTILVEQQI